MRKPVFPIFMLAKDDYSFCEYQSFADLSDCEWPDIEEGMYEGWDSTGRHFKLLWDRQNQRRVVELEEHPDFKSFEDAVEEYIRRYANSKHRKGFYETDGQRLRKVIAAFRNKKVE